MYRSEVREEIFKIIFRIPFTKQDELDQQVEFALEELENKSKENRDYIKEKSLAVFEHKEEIDEIISKSCDNWSIDRMGKAELSILRLSVYEMLYEEEVPVSVSINEAVELAKKYCDDNAYSFVNGILGKASKEIDRE